MDKEEEAPVYNSIDEIPRHKPSNPQNFTEEQIARRTREVKAAFIDYPNVPQSVIEMAWNVIEGTPKEEMEDIIKTNRWANAPKKERPQGGSYKCMTIEEPEEPKE
jgi:hypothetical protein